MMPIWKIVLYWTQVPLFLMDIKEKYLKKTKALARVKKINIGV